ncbi:hypothetical protein [Microbacterium yannicii]|uniref:hypothetical protein n=1 Tax=Microbacterium yannicii TaxID=671622 RepID=UPI0012F88C9C|nr:hypothetical protein [Microbacterium yannicii]
MNRSWKRRDVLRAGLWAIPAFALGQALTPSTASAATGSVPGAVACEVPGEPVVVPATGIFGPTGGHWPSRTPHLTDAFDLEIEVDPNWWTIQNTIAQALTQQPQGKIKIAVRPGVFDFGYGAGSTDHGVLQGVNASGRQWRVLVVPRDGWGTVTASGTIAQAASRGYSFVGVSGVSVVGFNFSDQAVLVRDSQDFALAWSTVGQLNVTANGANTTGIEFVECVLAKQIDDDNDRMAFRVANNFSIDGVTMRGCYVAPAYKAAGSSAHCDTLQASRSSGSGGIRNLRFEDSVFFQSSSQVLMMEQTRNVTLAHSAFIGGLRGTGRYPIGSGRHVMTGQNTLWGKTTDQVTGVNAADSFIAGSVQGWSFSSVANTVVSHNPPAAASGSFTVDATYAPQGTPLPTSWYSANCPMPDAARLASIWAAL